MRLNRCRLLSTTADKRPAGSAITNAPSEKTIVIPILLAKLGSENKFTNEVSPLNCPIW